MKIFTNYIQTLDTEIQLPLYRDDDIVELLIKKYPANTTIQDIIDSPMSNHIKDYFIWYLGPKSAEDLKLIHKYNIDMYGKMNADFQYNRNKYLANHQCAKCSRIIAGTLCLDCEAKQIYEKIKTSK